MRTASNSKILRIIPLLIAVCLIGVRAEAQYSGGTGEPNDPYQITTAADLMLLGESPEDYDKHFILTADIDLDPNLAGRKVFDKAVIAPDTDPNDQNSVFQGTPFSGIFDGNGYVIRNLHIEGDGYLGVFGKLGSGAKISNLGLGAADVNGTGDFIGSLVGDNSGSITTSYSTGTVNGDTRIGGLVGDNRDRGSVSNCYSTGSVSGGAYVGGLVGYSGGKITTSYSTGTVSGRHEVGGLVGGSWGGGVLHSIWDMETSRLTVSDGGVGLTTAEMMDPYVLGLYGFANDPNWILDAGRDYPRLAWEETPGQSIPEPIIDWLDGRGTEEEPYRIDMGDQLILLSRASTLWDKHFVLGADINVDPNLQGSQVFSQAVVQVFSGVFDGNDHTISHLTIQGRNCVGLFGYLKSGCEVSNLGLERVDVSGYGRVGGLVGVNFGSVSNCYSTGVVNGDSDVGGLVGDNRDSGSVSNSYSTGSVSGDVRVGGLAGSNHGNVSNCYSAGDVNGNRSLGGLVGVNYGSVSDCCSADDVNGYYPSVGGLVGTNRGSITTSYSTGTVTGGGQVGGLVGVNYGSISTSYSTGAVSGTEYVGGLVGKNSGGTIATSCSTGTVSGGSYVGGLVGYNMNWPSIAIITRSYSTGAVNGTGWVVGGLVGYNSGGTVTNCYSAGTVSGIWDVGGLVGDNNGGNITTSYSTGTVSGDDDDVGGLVGYYRSGCITSSFWDIETSSEPNMCGNKGGGTGEYCDNSYGKTTAEMKQQSTFEGWDFINVWGIGENQTYPYLRKYSAADINQDGIVNLLDLCIIAGQWMEEQQ